VGKNFLKNGKNLTVNGDKLRRLEDIQFPLEEYVIRLYVSLTRCDVVNNKEMKFLLFRNGTNSNRL
jgi:hypothetical protein